MKLFEEIKAQTEALSEMTQVPADKHMYERFDEIEARKNAKINKIYETAS